MCNINIDGKNIMINIVIDLNIRLLLLLNYIS